MPAAHRCYDLSRPLAATLAPWPGDTPFRYDRSAHLGADGPVNVGRVTMGVHNGTHVDAPCHFAEPAAGVEALALDPFWGLAVVLDLTRRSDPAAVIGPEALAELPAAALAAAPRLLLKTGGWPDDRTFPAAIPVLSTAAVAWLRTRGVRLLGVDLPSVDPIDSKTLDNHHALRAAGVQILEGLDLRAVPAGTYELAALPLRLVGADASPVRAVLRELAPPLAATARPPAG